MSESQTSESSTALKTDDPSKPWYQPFHDFKEMLAPIAEDLDGKLKIGYESRGRNTFGLYLMPVEGETVSEYRKDNFVGLNDKSSVQITRNSARHITKLIKKGKLTLSRGCRGGCWTAKVIGRPVKSDRCRVQFPDFTFKIE